ncbi:MAG: class I SAM-dependent methyltransferase [Gammaproteobacteria bacterium]|nr:class I SAM-dependent methyltransferase [Gammaproteobacteria bacterium]
MNRNLWNYLRHDKRKVQGWLQRVDAEIIGAILSFQAKQPITGGCVEIGVHHGKSFIPLCMALEGAEKALCIDVFDDQASNLDQSGRGNTQRLHENLETFGIDRERVQIIQDSSDRVSADDILGAVGDVRFFSIDGGHWQSIVLNDLALAEETLGSGGVIALDDYCRADWPEVTSAYSLWQHQTCSGIVPFAIGSNKLYLAHLDHAQAYRDALDTDFLNLYKSKTYSAPNAQIDCYRVEPFAQDEEKATDALMAMLKIFRPDRFVALQSILNRGRR